MLITGASIALAARAGGSEPPSPRRSAEWNARFEMRLVCEAEQDHGPDPGANEWQGVIEFESGIRDRPGLPGRDTCAWCEYIDGPLRA